MMPVFSIVLVSRQRPEMLGNLLRSIHDTSTLPYEVLIGFDNDDESVAQVKVPKEMKDKVLFFFQDRNPNLHTYLNKLANYSKGKYVFGLNDDCEIKNHGWDCESKKILDKFGEICYGVTQDNSIDKIGLKDYASFPVISRTAIQKLGFFMEESCGNHGSDVLTYRIFSTFGKTCQVPIYIRHIFHENQIMCNARLSDQTASEMIQRTMQENKLGELFTLDISEYVKRLNS